MHVHEGPATRQGLRAFGGTDRSREPAQWHALDRSVASRNLHFAHAVIVAVLATTGADRPRVAAVSHAPAAPVAGAEDYRRPAGTRIADTLLASFSIREVRWRPEGRRGADLPAFTFVEEGRPARIPGPVLRAPAGTLVRVRLHNTLGVRLAVFGLQDHAAGRGKDSVVLAAGERTTVSFRVTAPDTYYYWARVRPAVQHPTAPVPDDWPSGEKAEGGLLGALIVDAAGTAPPPGERILLIHRWLDDDDPRVRHNPMFKMMVNGASWPATERLRYTVGDIVRWRVINATATQHPMHLHGFHFTVTARGDGKLDTLLADGLQRQRVTEPMGFVPQRLRLRHSSRYRAES